MLTVGVVPYIPLVKGKIYLLFGALFGFYIVADTDDTVDEIVKVKVLCNLVILVQAGLQY